MKVLAYDRGLAARTKDGLKLAVVYDPKSTISKESRDSFESAFKSEARTLDGTTVEMVDMPEDGFDNAAKVGDLDIVVICSGANLARATAIAKNYKLISFAPDEGAVRNGVAVGLVPRDGKPKLLINVNASLAVNMSLDPQILRLAELIQ